MFDIKARAKVINNIRSRLSSGWLSSVWAKRLAVGTGGLLVGFVAINLVVYLVFLHRTYPNSRIAQHSIGSIAYGAVTPEISHLSLLPSSFTLKQSDQTFTVTAKELGVELDTSRIIAGSHKRDWLPLQNFFTAHTTPVYTKIDQTVLSKKLTAVAFVSKQEPTNASIALKNNQFVLDYSANGHQLDVTRSAAAITSAVEHGQTTVRLPLAPIKPAITEASLQTNLQQLQAQQALSLSYTYNGKTAKPSAATIAGWYTSDGSSYSLQASKIQAYISGIGTSYGIRVQNLAQAVTATQQAIQGVKPLALALTAVPPGVCSNNTASQLVVVSITQQHMWACEGYNQVYDTAVTTGAYQETPTGTWHIYAKETDVTLTGPTWNDFVNYWVPFYSDYGFHDASWQTFPFGSPQYTTDGSHGCVHLPMNAMTWLYGWSHIGTTVTITG